MSCNDLSFRAQFYEGLPASIYEWAVTHEGAYTSDFGSVLARVRERMVSRRAVAGRSRASRPSNEIGAASGDQRNQSGSLECYRCGGAHRVKDCPKRRKSPAAKVPKKGGCFKCGSTEHFVRDCPSQARAEARAGAQAAVTAGEESGFRVEGADRGGVPSKMETE